MSMNAASWGMMLSSGTEAYMNYAAGKQIEASYKAQAKETEMQNVYARRLALEEMKDLSQQGRSAESAAVAAAGKSGVRVGGSVVTMTDAIRRKVGREKAMMLFKVNEQVRRGETEAAQLRYAGKAARQARKVQAWGTLLTGGVKLAKYEQKKGSKNWWDTFFTRPET